MAIWVDGDTRVMIQGITGRQGRYHAARTMEDHGRLVGGVVPGRGGASVVGVPVFDRVATCRAETGATASLVLVPPPAVYDAVDEAIEAGVSLIVVVTEHVPVLDSLRLVHRAAQQGVRLIGPNTIGIISPGLGKVGIMPASLYRPGSVGILSRSGTLTHEVASNLSACGIGQSTCIGVGGDSVVGTSFVDGLEQFRLDDQTERIILIGEIGGHLEQEAAAYLEQGYPKPVHAYVAGRTAPPARRMGHAGAIVDGDSGQASEKARAFEQAGVRVVSVADELIAAIKEGQ